MSQVMVPSAHPAFEAWRELGEKGNESLRALYIMVGLEVAGFAMCIPVMSFFFIKELGLSPSQVGIVISCNATSQLVGAWATGRLSDSIGRRWLLLGSYLWSSVGIGALALVLDFTQLIILRSVQGLSGGTANLSQAFILDWVPEHKHPAYMGLNGAVVGTAFLIGNVAGMGFISIGLERRAIFLVAACFCLMATLYGYFTITESLDISKRRPLFKLREEGCCHQIGEMSDCEVVGLGLTCTWAVRFFSAFAGAVMFSTYAFLIDKLFGWTDLHYGIIMACFGIFYTLWQVVLYPIFGRHGKQGSAMGMVLGSICGVCAGLVLPLEGVVTHAIGIFLLTFTYALFAPAIPVLIGLFAGSRHIGFANGISHGCDKLAGIIGPFLGGMLHELGVWSMFLFGVACYIICAVGSGAICAAQEAGDREDEAKPLCANKI